jgi:predicted DNA-binding transcriptional regulator AlpA
MAKRKSDPTLAGQLDMFGDAIGKPRLSPNQVRSMPLLTGDDVIAANDTPQETIIANDVPVNDDMALVETEVLMFEVETDSKTQSPEPRAPVHQSGASAVWLNDEWWTTAMVCAYLKLGRKAIWERTRHPTIGFPQPTHFGSCRHRWRAGEVKAWADLVATR